MALTSGARPPGRSPRRTKQHGNRNRSGDRRPNHAEALLSRPLGEPITAATVAGRLDRPFVSRRDEPWHRHHARVLAGRAAPHRRAAGWRRACRIRSRRWCRSDGVTGPLAPANQAPSRGRPKSCSPAPKGTNRPVWTDRAVRASLHQQERDVAEDEAEEPGQRVIDCAVAQHLPAARSAKQVDLRSRGEPHDVLRRTGGRERRNARGSALRLELLPSLAQRGGDVQERSLWVGLRSCASTSSCGCFPRTSWSASASVAVKRSPHRRGRGWRVGGTDRGTATALGLGGGNSADPLTRSSPVLLETIPLEALERPAWRPELIDSVRRACW